MSRRTLVWTMCGCAAMAAGCSSIERTPPPPRSARIDADRLVPVPQVMRGTVASEAVLQGYQPVAVHGLGLVVGLKGTGSSDVPPDVRAQILATAARHGIGSERLGLGDLTPEDLLDSPDTAVVVVRGVIPPAAPEGTSFDVTVSAFPTSSTSSLEGGRLYTAELLPRTLAGQGFAVLPPTGSRQPRGLALARGPVLVNPFAEPGAIHRDTIDRRNGRIQGGGLVTADMPLKLRLITPSHARATVLQSAINTRFPREPGQRGDSARGESDESIEITVPPSYHDRTEEFIDLLRHTTIRQAGTEQVAVTVRRHLLENPADAEAASWRFQALGPRAIPVIRDLYDHPDELPRLAALRAGARLDDALVAPHLIRIAGTASSAAFRREAIELLAGMDVNPLIDQALRQLTDDEEVEVRLAAYEALVERRDPSVERHVVDDKFVLDVVESKRPLVYITQTGMPRVALFGRGAAIGRPVTVTAWSQRFMIKGDPEEDQLEVYFRPEGAPLGVIHRVAPELTEFVQFLGHTTGVDRPAPGLGLSYSEVVGVLHQIWRQGFLDADFLPEADLRMAALLRQPPPRAMTERPEFAQDEPGPLTDESAPASGVLPPAPGSP